ncbi:hypothetical protein BCA37_23860 [Mycobacterium sp. djl-10]|nr:hypothetical protein BCA37_23860 [Mycobacterium sp. djl-10]
MNEVASRRRNQPAPPFAVFDDLCDPDRQPARPWLLLHDDEIRPTVVDSARPTYVEWSTLWTRRPDAIIRFDVTPAPAGTDLRWTLFLDDPTPDPTLTGHLRRRINELINANLRYTYGQ